MSGMQLDLFIKNCSSLEGQRKALRGLERAEIRGTLTPAAALSFGVVPVCEHDGRLVLAALPSVHPDCEGALSAALKRPVLFVKFDGGLVHEAIGRHYLGRKGDNAGVDLPTFKTPGFLKDRRAAKRLLSEKRGALPAEEIRLAPDRVAFLDIRVHSVLRSLDLKRSVEFAPTKSMLAFRLEREAENGGEPQAVLFREKLPPAEVKAIVSQGLFYDGDEHVHAVVSKDLTGLPHVIHPSELQLAGLDEDEARLWIYDRIETVRAGRTASWSAKYYFVHFGARLERTLRLDVLAFATVPRSNIRLAGMKERLAPAELERVFGLDFGRGATGATVDAEQAP
jgi:hypothetical protein